MVDGGASARPRPDTERHSPRLYHRRQALRLLAIVGGAFMLPDGSLAVLQRGAERSLEQTRSTILAFQNGVFRHARDCLFAPAVEDNDPPETDASVAPPANEAGWTRPPATLSLSAKYNQAVRFVRYTLTNASFSEERISALTDVEVPLGEGRWTIAYSALDIYGNEEPQKEIEALIDGSAPNTEVELQGTEGNEGWFVSSVEVILTSDDPKLADGSDGSGVLRTEYSLDGGGTWQTYEGPFTIEEEGTSTVNYRAADVAGNIEKENEVVVKIDTVAPEVTIESTPDELWPPNRKPVSVTVKGSALDETSGVHSASFEVLDEYDEWEPTIDPLVFNGEATTEWEFGIELVAWRKGADRDGRVYTIRVLVADIAGNASEVEATVIVPHDQGQPPPESRRP